MLTGLLPLDDEEDAYVASAPDLMGPSEAGAPAPALLLSESVTASPMQSAMSVSMAMGTPAPALICLRIWSYTPGKGLRNHA